MLSHHAGSLALSQAAVLSGIPTRAAEEFTNCPEGWLAVGSRCLFVDQSAPGMQGSTPCAAPDSRSVRLATMLSNWEVEALYNHYNLSSTRVFAIGVFFDSRGALLTALCTSTSGTHHERDSLRSSASTRSPRLEVDH